MFLLDTNAVIDILGKNLPVSSTTKVLSFIDDESTISIITKMEALGYNFKEISEEKSMNAFVDGSNIIGIDDEITNKTIAIRKLKKISLPDAIIAATAIVRGFTLLTSNTADFKNIPELRWLDVRAL